MEKNVFWAKKRATPCGITLLALGARSYSKVVLFQKRVNCFYYKMEKEGKKRCAIYIDGFNWYYGIFRHKPAWKWLNLESYFDELRLDDEVVFIKFFTALVEPHLRNSTARMRQVLYHEALKTLPRVKIILGTYTLREVRCLATCKEPYLAPEEKKTDVNVAVHLLDDAIKKVAEHFIIVSGDSDLEPAVYWLKRNNPDCKVTVYIPVLPEEGDKRSNRYYGQQGITCKFLPLDRMLAHQLPSRVPHSTMGEIQRPSSWV